MSKFNYKSEDESLSYFKANENSLYPNLQNLSIVKYLKDRDVLLLTQLHFEHAAIDASIYIVDVIWEAHGSHGLLLHKKQDLRMDIEGFNGNTLIKSQLRQFRREFEGRV
ncbi:hypothetical protein E2P86_08675 [Sphingobacterium psychroaquaticum]|uniref:hypothetical protein n=1 Tax=Sphingobacterium psychroaquaticum TaxID=561061 RepID=UPI00106AF43B|nr:hypothetical protein [Sphingobacterium psychroaquaticum]QBQ41227.1 hypothetical protein E2P86_08675 [Sphingobacterium psychroaquaticum]